MNTSTWLAIALGGLAGALVAIAGSGRSSAPPPLPPVAALPLESEQTRLSPPAASAVPEAKSADTHQAPSPPASPPSAAPEASAPSAPAPVPAVSSQDELTRAEIACREKREASACRTAALAYEQGLVVPADPAKGKLFRRIELTFLVKQCEGQVPSACAELAGRYERGEGVPQSARNAAALRERVKELCASRGGARCP